MVALVSHTFKAWSTAALVVCLVSLGGLLASSAYSNEPSRDVASSGGFVSSMALGATPKYAKDFTQFSYTDPLAKPGGELRLAAMGSFDKLNPFTLKGIPARGLSELVFEPLAIGSLDEPMSMYGLLAESMRLAPDELSMTFRLSPKARFSNGLPVLAADVKFSFDTLRSLAASPIWRNYWADVKDAVVLDERTIRFNFLRRNRELHMTVASLPVFSKSWGGELPFDQWVMQPPVGSGPYRVSKVDAGKLIAYERRIDYWASNHPTRRFQFNFNRISFRYYKDYFAKFAAFRAGDFDITEIGGSAEPFQAPPHLLMNKLPDITSTTLPHSNPAGIQGFFFNTRRQLFQDVRVRQAISLAMDFEWINQRLFGGIFTRMNSYFTHSDFAASGLPSNQEQNLLTRLAYQNGLQVPNAWTLMPTPEPAFTGGVGGLRQNLLRAKGLFMEAGWFVRDGKLVNIDGKAFEFEILVSQRQWERILVPFVYNLQKLGIRVNVKVMEDSLYQGKLMRFDYDMIIHRYVTGRYPGNELVYRFTSSSAEQAGSANYAGISEMWVDSAVREIVSASDFETLNISAKVLDRILRHGYYVIPLWYKPSFHVLHRKGMRFPAQPPLYFGAEWWAMMSWWWERS